MAPIFVNLRTGEKRMPHAWQWDAAKQRKSLDGDPAQKRAGDTRELSALVAMRKSSRISFALQAELEKIEWRKIWGWEKTKIMRGEVTVALFKLVMGRRKFTGDNVDKLKAILADASKAGHSLTFVSLSDAKEFAERLSGLTNRKFRIQAETEWFAARKRLSGENWTWMKDRNKGLCSNYILRHLKQGYELSEIPGKRGERYAIRLVEVFE